MLKNESAEFLMAKYDYVIFDFDGTLADSSEGIFYTSTTVMKELGFPGPWETQALRRFIGPPLPDSFRAAFALDESKIDWAVDRYREIYKEVGPKGCHLYDGIEELVCYLKGKGIKVGKKLFYRLFHRVWSNHFKQLGIHSKSFLKREGIHSVYCTSSR